MLPKPLLNHKRGWRAKWRAFVRHAVTRTRALTRSTTNDKAAQLLLAHQYRAMAAQGIPISSFDVGMRYYSQTDEDGTLLYLSALIAPRQKTCLEICCGHGQQSNTANLIINHGWAGALFDGSAENILQAAEFYERQLDIFLTTVTLKREWITAENINQLVKDSGFAGEIGLLSLDIDGIDLWVWKALHAADPAIFVCEVNPSIPPHESLSIPYRADFVMKDPSYFGASLKAMVTVAAQKGYRLVAVNKHGFNAFFVKTDAALKSIPTLTLDECFARCPYWRQQVGRNWERLKKQDWVPVT